VHDAQAEKVWKSEEKWENFKRAESKQSAMKFRVQANRYLSYECIHVRRLQENLDCRDLT
jgi:hypothetical protein